jgi:hypothetical protein
MQEVALVFDEKGKALYWHEPYGRSQSWLPDSRELWDVLWQNRATLGGVAHTHPWHGRSLPSSTDVTTFLAIETALGKQLLWPIITLDDARCFVRDPAGNYVEKLYALHGQDWREEQIEEMRQKSLGG